MTKPGPKHPPIRLHRRDLKLFIDKATAAVTIIHTPTRLVARCTAYATINDNVIGARGVLRDMLRHAARKLDRKRATALARKLERQQRRRDKKARRRARRTGDWQSGTHFDERPTA